MAVVSPFRALRYDAAYVGDLGAVVAPPYDVISSAQQDALYARSRWNVVRLILPREPGRAAAAATTLRAWIESGVLALDPEPALYFYSQEFSLSDGSRHRRDGVLCRLGLEEFASGVVRPHERTFPGPKADQLALLRATGAYLSPIFGLYARPGERLRDVAAVSGPPLVELTEEHGERHRLWRVTDPRAVARVAAALAAETIFIADGHHRYETALAYRAERGAEGSGAILAFISNMEEPGLVVLPTHRLLRVSPRLAPGDLEGRLRESFAVEPLPAEGARPAGALDVVLPDRRLRLRPLAAARARVAGLPPTVRGLDVAVLHGAILEPILGVGSAELDFTHEDGEAFAAVASGRATAAFLLNPPSVVAVRAVCLAGELMPEKSTYFYPKLASGLVFDLVGPPGGDRRGWPPG
jgi:uncharacterized protein (DUF1015 family)